MKKSLFRYCPVCNIKIDYLSRESCRNGERKNSLCRSCSTKQQYISNPNKNKGNENGRFNKTLLEVMINKYGDVDGKFKFDVWKKNMLATAGFKCGINNPQYGKPSKINSVISYSGWYKNLYFRSSYELAFIIEYERKMGILPESAETKNIKIPYVISGKTHNYIPDFYCSINNRVFEIKPYKYIHSTTNILKHNAALNYFKKSGISYVVFTEKELKIINWQRYIFEDFFNKILNKEIQLTKKSFNKFKNALKKKNMIEKLNKISKLNQ